MMNFIRRLFGRCTHNWEVLGGRVVLNEFRKAEEDDSEDEVFFSRDFARYRCAKCGKIELHKL